MVQVTVETDRAHARRLRDRRRAHRARGDAARRHRPELRDRPGRDDRAPPLPRAARAHLPLVPAERRAAVGRRRPHALRPHARRARRRARALRRPSSASTSSAGAAAPRPSTCAAVVERIGSARADRAHARVRAGLRRRSTAHVAVPPGARVPRHRRAHERQRLAGSSATRCSKPTGTRACRWHASR